MRPAAAAILRAVEPLLYGRRWRPLTALLLAFVTLAMAWQALHIRPDAAFEKTLPVDHPYMQVLRQYQAEFGGANIVLVALLQKQGDVYNERFLSALKAATDEVTFIPGIDRTHVSSLFTKDVRFIEVVDGGFAAGDVVPADYAPGPEMFERIRQNVAKAGIAGRLVSKDQRGAMVVAEVLAGDPLSGQRTDLVRVARDLEDQLRGRFGSPVKYRYRLKDSAAGEGVLEMFAAPGWMHPFRDYRIREKTADGSPVWREVSGRDLTVETVPNPQYNPDLSVHIIGFTKVVGDVTDAAIQVALFFALTVLGTMLALWMYLGRLRLALLPLGCSLVAVVWEFGLLKTFGLGLDPFAIMVPFLVLAVSTSHGVQYVNVWADEVAGGQNGFEASRTAFRRLFIPGSIALITNVAGFMTIALVPIGGIREMSINACLGMLAVIVTNKVMMPIWLSMLRLPDVEGFRARRGRRQNAGDRFWSALSRVTDPPVAAGLIVLSFVVLAASWSVQHRRIIGDAQSGVPELRPDSTYNRDVAAIVNHFSIGSDVLKIVAEADANTCVQYGVLEQMDDFVWRMRNVAGVQSALAFSDATRKSYSGMLELNPKFRVLPRDGNILVLVNRGIQTSTGLLNFDCSAMPITLFMQDHKAETIERVVQAVQQNAALGAREFYEAHPEAHPEMCAQKFAQRRQIGTEQQALEQQRALLLAQGINEQQVLDDPQFQVLQAKLDAAKQTYAGNAAVCPLYFAIGTGNISVMAATNEVVAEQELPMLLAVYAVITGLILLSYRSLAGLLAIGIPLFMVSVFANALMAVLGIGLKVATLPVVTLAVGIGVDYGIYIYDQLQERMRQPGATLRQAYNETLRHTGKAVIFTGLCLAGGVVAWLFSDLQFQRDMGLLLVFMFTANMLGAVLLCPAYCRFLMQRRSVVAPAP